GFAGYKPQLELLVKFLCWLPVAGSIPDPTSPGLHPAPSSTCSSGAEGPTAAPRAEPWPAPVIDIGELCACDLLAAQCDANCCCDPDCTPEDFSLFTTYSIPVVTGDSQLCIQEAARIFRLVNKINPNIFCIHITNYKQALSFIPPEIPTLHNFDRLLKEFGGVTFNTEFDVASDTQSDIQKPSDSNETARYEYGVPIQTSDAFLRLPVPLVFSQCADSNPADFLVEQAVKCSRTVNVEDCTAIPALSMLFYTNSSILAIPNSLQKVPIAVQSITVQSPKGTRICLNSSVILQPKLGDSQMCTNVVLGSLSGSERTIQLLSSVTFTDVLTC
uniref:Tectonic family member 1 n=1 Tax=Sphenodon punctatus TaxID=8508 RepID=A0A8D0H0S3_SPHPU